MAEQAKAEQASQNVADYSQLLDQVQEQLDTVAGERKVSFYEKEYSGVESALSSLKKDLTNSVNANQKIVDGKENKEEEKNTKRKKNSKRNYNEVFLCKPIPVFRKSRTIQLEEELYFKILKLTSVPGNAISIANFINNLLCNHFEIYEEDINEIYQSMIDRVYKNNNL